MADDYIRKHLGIHRNNRVEKVCLPLVTLILLALLLIVAAKYSTEYVTLSRKLQILKREKKEFNDLMQQAAIVMKMMKAKAKDKLRNMKLEYKKRNRDMTKQMARLATKEEQIRPVIRTLEEERQLYEEGVYSLANDLLTCRRNMLLCKFQQEKARREIVSKCMNVSEQAIGSGNDTFENESDVFRQLQNVQKQNCEDVIPLNARVVLGMNFNVTGDGLGPSVKDVRNFSRNVDPLPIAVRTNPHFEANSSVSVRTNTSKMTEFA